MTARTFLFMMIGIAFPRTGGDGPVIVITLLQGCNCSLKRGDDLFQLLQLDWYEEFA